MKYGIEVRVVKRKSWVDGEEVFEWRRMHATGRRPYAFATREEAERVMAMTHASPETRDDARIVEIEEV